MSWQERFMFLRTFFIEKVIHVCRYVREKSCDANDPKLSSVLEGYFTETVRTFGFQIIHTA
jgi:hypothetical protein